MSERYHSMSPYNFTFNNPIYWTDPDGKCPDCDRENSHKEGDKWNSIDGQTYEYIGGDWAGLGGNGYGPDVYDEVSVTPPAAKYNYWGTAQQSAPDENDPYEYAYWIKKIEQEMARQGRISALNKLYIEAEAKSSQGYYNEMSKLNNETFDTGEKFAMSGLALEIANTGMSAGKDTALVGSKTAKYLGYGLRANAATGLAITLTSNAVDISKDGFQTSNVLDGMVYATILGVGFVASAPVAVGLTLSYGIYQIWDNSSGGVGSNYIDKHFPINGN